MFWSDRCLFLFEALSDSLVCKGETYTRFYCITFLLAIFSYQVLNKISPVFILVEINPQTVSYMQRHMPRVCCSVVCHVQLKRCLCAADISALHT